jgi:hypothetical protein
MPANPRPLLDARRDRLARAGDFDDRGADRLDRLADDFRARVRERVEDFFELDPWLFVSPFSRRILFTVRAATSSARPPYRPDFLALCLMCLYCRSRFGLAPRGIRSSFPWCYRHLREI